MHCDYSTFKVRLHNATKGYYAISQQGFCLVRFCVSRDGTTTKTEEVSVSLGTARLQRLKKFQCETARQQRLKKFQCLLRQRDYKDWRSFSGRQHDYKDWRSFSVRQHDYKVCRSFSVSSDIMITSFSVSWDSTTTKTEEVDQSHLSTAKLPTSSRSTLVMEVGSCTKARPIQADSLAYPCFFTGLHSLKLNSSALCCSVHNTDCPSKPQPSKPQIMMSWSTELGEHQQPETKSHLQAFEPLPQNTISKKFCRETWSWKEVLLNVVDLVNEGL